MKWLKIGILALIVSSVVLFAALAIAQTNNPTIENLFGSWNVEVTTVQQGSTFPALLTFTADGSLIADEPPAPGETSGHGNWVLNADGEAAYTFIALFSGEEGAYAGKLKVFGTLQYDAETNSWQGPFQIDVYDAAGEVIASDTGTFSLTRIEIESLD